MTHKQRPLDLVPSRLLKNISDTMAPVIDAMCNASVTQNKCAVNQKCALVHPLLKKQTSDPLDLNSYRPISNFTFVSKILEHVIDSRIADHADTLGLFSSVQSAYRRLTQQKLLLSKSTMILLVALTEVK